MLSRVSPEAASKVVNGAGSETEANALHDSSPEPIGGKGNDEGSEALGCLSCD